MYLVDLEMITMTFKSSSLIVDLDKVYLLL